TPRRGATIVYAMVVTAIISLLMADIARHVMSARRLLEARANALQAHWLARSGIELAAGKLLADQNYRGEEPRTSSGGLVQIKVEQDPQSPQIYIVLCNGQFSPDDRATTRIDISRMYRRTKTDGRIVLTLVPNP